MSFAFLVLSFTGWLSTPVLGAESHSVGHAFGREIRSTLSADALPSKDGLALQVQTRVLSKKTRNLLRITTQTNALLEGESRFYWNGIQVAGNSGEWKDGRYTYTVGIPPARLRLPLVKVPVGPIEVAVDTGIFGEANANASLTPELGFPLEMVSVAGRLRATATAGAFLEGYAKYLIVRGGIGGELKLIDADAGITARVYAKGRPPEVEPEGWVNFLSGRFYSFLDYYSVIGARWRRVIRPTLRKWAGKCSSFGSSNLEDSGCKRELSSPPSLSLD